MHSKKSVVITGIGLVTPVGKTARQSWDSVVAGRSGIAAFYSDIDFGHAASVAGQVGDIKEQLDAILSPSEQRRTDRFIHLSLIAAREAMHDSGLTQVEPICRERFGSYVGVGIGGLGVITDAAKALDQSGYRSISPFTLPRAISNEAPAWLSIKFGLKGPTMAVVNACSSGNDAIGQAFRAIQDGHADYMLAGGTESCLTPLAFVGFGNMRALSTWKGDPTRASRPFDKDRSGFVMAEGAGFLVLERADLARKRGATIYAELAGYGAHSDAYHITAIHPEGYGAVHAIEHALEQGGVNKQDVGYVNAHGTATPMNDPAETKILRKVFGDCENLLVSSTKSMTGHMLGAAGGVEVAFSALALKHGVLPPTINLENQDDLCDLNYVPGQAREKKVTCALSNSFGFGGANSVILLKR
ncbi:beta-ketoacyl-ACP synthase II [Candidatus Dependentiae bacterium]|nr:beta-ketoacyl-ACP synthase II [Candidatus Dependentiae bacterium]